MTSLCQSISRKVTCLILLRVHCGVAIARSLTRRERVPRWRSPWQLANGRGGSCAAPVRESVHPVYRVLARERLDASLAPPNWQRAGRGGAGRQAAAGGARVGVGAGEGGGRRRAHVRLWPKSDRAEPNRTGVGVAVGPGEQLKCNGKGKGE